MHYRIFIFAVLLMGSVSRADILPPEIATGAISPNGQSVIRVRHGKVFRYALDTKSNTFTLVKQFNLRDPSPQFVYVSDHGDVVCIWLSDPGAIELYSSKGVSLRQWNLGDFLSHDQIQCCAQTGATTQWIDEAKFYDRDFVFRGPSQRVRRVASSYTLMRTGNPTAIFAFILDCKTAKLTEDRDEDRTEPSDAPKDRASRIDNGNHNAGPR